MIRDYESPEEFVGMTMTIVFNSMRKAFQKFNCDHAVICMDSASWRKVVYEEYKAHRKKDEQIPEEAEKGALTKQMMKDISKFLREFCNVTVLEEYGLEADDFIARWIQRHPDSDHVIISADSDFKQLVTDRVELFNPLNDTMYTMSGVFFQDHNRIGKNTLSAERYGERWKVKLDKKTGEPELFDPEWELFVKCIRGDVSDNIKSAFPRVHMTKMRKAFEAKRNGNAAEWNNFLNEQWGPPESRKVVKDRYFENKLLIDLTEQPPDVIEYMDEAISREIAKTKRMMVAVYFQKFCAKYGLERVAQSASQIVPLLSLPYIKK